MHKPRGIERVLPPEPKPRDVIAALAVAMSKLRGADAQIIGRAQSALEGKWIDGFRRGSEFGVTRGYELGYAEGHEDGRREALDRAATEEAERVTLKAAARARLTSAKNAPDCGRGNGRPPETRFSRRCRPPRRPQGRPNPGDLTGG